MKPLVFRVAAAADLEEAYRWYEGQRQGLGEDFLSAVQVAIETVGSNPEAHPTSLWEIAIKVSLGKLVLARPFAEFIPEQKPHDHCPGHRRGHPGHQRRSRI